MRAIVVVRDGITNGVSCDIIDESQKPIGRIDLIGPLPSGRRFWERYDAAGTWQREGECTKKDVYVSDHDLALDIWCNRIEEMT
jgi:hypothetical protein